MKKMQNKGYDAVQAHSKSLRLLQIESPFILGSLESA